MSSVLTQAKVMKSSFVQMLFQGPYTSTYTSLSRRQAAIEAYGQNGHVGGDIIFRVGASHVDCT
ncbi:MAG: hypothetical protein GY696_38035 [Gammaproteobacteria bacterium]|nr:hypothetical protein [Gammaproteobacteria bacterium]